MKKSTILAFTVAAFMSVVSLNGHAAAGATYDDSLILPNPVNAPAVSDVVLIPVASPQAVKAVHNYVTAWQNAEVNYTKAKAKHDNHEKLTKAESKWLHSKDKHNYADYFRTHSLGRVHGFEVAFNWNGENRNKNDYEFFDMPKYNEQNGFVNSYGYNVLRGMVDQINEVIQQQKEIGGPMTTEEADALEDAILDIMAHDQQNVTDEDLRQMMNEVVWYAAKETVKNKASEEPTKEEEHVVDLRKAINEPIENAKSNRVDLRKAIQQ